MPDDPKPGSALKPLAILLITLLVLAAILNYVDRLAISAIAPTLKDEFSLTNERWGWMIAAFNLVYIFSSMFGGMWIDRVGVRKGLLISTIVWSLAAAGHALATGFWSLCFWRMLLAVGEGPGAASLLKGVRRLLPPHLRDTGNGLIGAGWAAGAVIAPLLIGPVAVKFGWQAGFLATASLCFLWIPFWLVFAFRPGVPLGVDAVKLTTSSDEKPQPLNYRSYALWATLLAIFFTVPPTVFMNGFLSLYLSDAHHLTQAQINAQQWKPFLATDLGQLTGGAVVFLLLRQGWRYLPARRYMIAIGFVGSVLMLGVLTAPDVYAAIAWLCVSRFYYQAAYTALGTYGIESVAEHQTAQFAGLMNAVFSGCNLVFNPLVGRIADKVGFNLVIVIIAFAPLLGLACWLILSEMHARRVATAEVAAPAASQSALAAGGVVLTTESQGGSP
jgi:ACS family hexuronate transporter-like MFS transporter